MTVYGTRPEAIKLAPLIASLDAHPHLSSVPVITGQHLEMLSQVNTVFGIEPRHDIAVFEPGMPLTRLAGKTTEAVGALLRSERPDAVLVQGDTTSALAAGLAAFCEQIPVIHLEAGLRTASIATPFPEEGNRRMLSQITTLHLAPTPAAHENLVRSGVDQGDIVVTGNTVIDALHSTVARGADYTDPALSGLDVDPRRVVLVTSHRRESWGEPMRRVAGALAELARRRDDVLFVLPLHANPAVATVFTEALSGRPNVLLTPSLAYPDLCRVLNRCTLVITDSGGLQEEAPALGKPVLVLRDDTERPEAVAAGTALLVGTDPTVIIGETERLLDDTDAYVRMARAQNPFGDGHAAARCTAAIASLFDLAERLPDFDPTAGHRPMPHPTQEPR